ncbi:ABC transporter permease (plasmid) [Haloferax mediterranei ATCC 33500]|uniref:ABC transporter permease n=1 Tax=Haloferax mediterranei (strain ATCC 33500 / DSM 1411 / JCM 8866 / NBRC 14739 / NCIMB 2177 / R-4) TaxID=523841 RepID=I3R9T7_HALMT|nr:FtsX-like permease family protein [Haloferax mediterranei]AFK20997.1 ABC transporter permease protein [Haloferax mediterranei ATCC 33500]AHZ24142.1 ABC transporter permease [Haloferax mediterranei ATCC 33500]EMA05218.1 ABC transporter permease [Haloferax mediterranei ATCC 33500]MDX5989978.1 FtsX-like permease family protein [Haloferax mediterranei ATCC 33500]QCQ77162.1 ABC transporter permease [Haloferax mediterranei ATCC 33500]
MSWLYRIVGRFPRLVIARRNISRAKARSILAAASILIGVVAIGAIGAGGAAFKQSQLQNIQDQGATNVFVSPGFDMEGSYFDQEDLKAIDETVGPAGIVATRSGEMEIIKRDGTREGISVTYLDNPRKTREVERGQIPDNWRQSVVVSHDFADERDIAPGERVKLVSEEETAAGTVETEHTYRVVAVLAEARSFGWSEIYLPIEQAEDRRYSQVRVTTSSTDRAEAVAEALRDRFNDRKDKLLVFELTSLVRMFKTIVNGINTFLAGLGSISLLVAGVSITNTMLMAVIKRREEIGVLRAVGYSKGDIVQILLLESVLLGALGSGVGIVIAIGVALVANSMFLGDPFAFTQSALLYLAGAIAFGILTSLLAGVYPAWRAANERPIDALRG